MNFRSMVEVPAVAVLAVICLLAIPGYAQERNAQDKQEKKDLSFAVGPGAVICITNNYGPITVKPSGNSQVSVETISHSDAITLENEQHGDRVDLHSISSRPGTNLVEYTVLVPAAAFVSLRSSDGTLRAQGLRGDVVLEAAAGSVEVTNVSDAHLHVKTLGGPITLTNISNSHVEIHSVSGDVILHNVAGPSVEVNSGSGRIAYDGDPGRVGEYLLTSHTGNLDISIPATAWVQIKARSIKSQSDPDFPAFTRTPSEGQNSLLGKPGKIIGSRFELRSFSGKIRLKRP
jgi:Putative adhesin